MVRVAMLYKYLDIMVYMLIAIVVFIILLEISIILEKRFYAKGGCKYAKIIGKRPDDERIEIKYLTLMPGTDYIYFPVYAYTKDGIEYVSYFYSKCKHDLES